MTKLRFESDDPYGLNIHSRGYLPHWEIKGSSYFVTIRTAGAVSPQEVAKLTLNHNTPDKKRRAILGAYEAHLDRTHERGPLRGPAARVVAEAIQFRNGSQFQVLAWCVMPNHIHLVFRLGDGHQLSSVMHSLKSYTAHEVNKATGRTGALWEREYFDRLVRPGKLASCVNYVLSNPLRANLTGWPWVGAGEPPALQPQFRSE